MCYNYLVINWEVFLFTLAFAFLALIFYFLLPKKKPLLKLETSIKGYSFEQDRIITPKDTVKNAVKQIEKMYDLSGFRLVPCDNPIADAFSFSSISDQFNCSGKGLTPEQSQASAVMEFAERYSWYHFDYKTSPDYKIASYQEMKKNGVRLVPASYFLSQDLDHSTTPEISEEIYSAPLIWIRAVSLTKQTYYYYPINWHNILFGSNGLAGGNTREEAIRHALCEVIERENLARFFIDQQPARDLDQTSIDHPLVRKVLKEAREADIYFVIKDISFGLGIPTFIVYGTSKKDAGQLQHQGCGQGCHPDPIKALIRGLAEYFEGYSLMKQTQNKVNLDFLKVLRKMPPRHYGFLSRLHTELLSAGKMTVRLDQIRDLSSRDIKKEIEKLVTILRLRGLEVIVMEKTHPRLQIPVVRVLVPGMRNPIGFENFSAYGALAQVWYEAKNEEKAFPYFQKYVRQHPLLSRLSESFRNLKDLNKFYGKSYQETALRSVNFKKNSTELLAKIQKELGNKFPKEYQLY